MVKDNIQDVTDPTDWLETSLPSFKEVDAALRCEVCKDFYRTPMITACSHTFCSLCIRRCLVNDGKCPTCRTSEQEIRLRSNWALERLVDEFMKARPMALAHASNHVVKDSCPSPKRKLHENDFERDRDQPRKRIRPSRHVPAPLGQEAGIISIDDDGYDEDYQPDDGRAECPICKTRMKIELVYSHVERCDGQQLPNRSAASSQSSSLQNGANQPRNHSLKMERLARLNYSLLKEQALRKKLAELGIPSAGNRQQLERRHIEWVTLWNANCDSSKPRKKSELLSELDVWERTQGMRAPSLIKSPDRSSRVLSKEFDGAGWAAKHGRSFQSLIASARRGVKKEPPGLFESKKETAENNESESAGADAINLKVDTIQEDTAKQFMADEQKAPCDKEE